MNLVAKEFVACQVEERGVLVLSRFTGAAEEIDGAMLINPFNIDGFVEGIRSAIEMGEARAQGAHAPDAGAAATAGRSSTGCRPILARTEEDDRGADDAESKRRRERARCSRGDDALAASVAAGSPLVVMLDVDGTLVAHSAASR